MNTSGFAVVIRAILVGIVVVATAAFVWPCLHRGHHPGPASDCQSRMRRIGMALKLYAADWDNTYPTNRPWVSRGKLGRITSRVRLSKDATDPKTGEPLVFENGVNWVEALSKYVETVSTDGSEWRSYWQCGAVGKWVRESPTAAITYVFNRNLVELAQDEVKSQSNLMMVREMDRLVDAELRPTNDSRGTSNTPPKSPFLTDRDVVYGKTTPEIHRQGSHILFADGHVKSYDTSYFVEIPTADLCWDVVSKQWYNAANNDPTVPRAYPFAIAISP